MNPIPEDTTQVVRKGVEQACKDFSKRIAPLGFVRTRKMLWTRPHAYTVDVIHLHRSGSTYGKPINYSVSFRVHFAVRVLNDTFPAPALNGPFSDPDRLRTGRYHLRFNAQTGSTYERCVDDLTRFAVEQGEPWFQRFGDCALLVNAKDSPLQPAEKERLQAALDGREQPDMVAQSLSLLGIKAR